MIRTNRSRKAIEMGAQADFIVNNLTRSGRETFLRELLVTTLSGGDVGDLISSWFETAEINADKPRKRKLQSRIRKLNLLLGDNA